MTGNLNIHILTQTKPKDIPNHLMDLTLTDKHRSLYSTSTVTTGLSGCHKLILSCSRAHFNRFPPNKMFDEAIFLNDPLHKDSVCHHEESFAVFSLVFRDVVETHAPSKQKTICENNGPFMIKQLIKAIMDRLRIKNRNLKWPEVKKGLTPL